MTRITTQGECEFCHQSYSKGGMSRHLASCEARQAAVHEMANQPGMHAARMLHLRVEGQDRPEYWMDIEIPAEAALYHLDAFLRDIWLECCGHMSAFSIEGREFLSDDDDDMAMFSPLTLSAVGEDGEPGDENSLEQAKEGALQLARMIGASEQAQAQFVADFDRITAGQTPSTEEEAQVKIKELASAMGRMLGMNDAMVSQMLGTMGLDMGDEEDLEEEDEEDENIFGGFGSMGGQDEETMDVPLNAVLRPGLSFHHEYDFGSTTELVLRVIEERDGYASDPESMEEDYVHLLAQNEPPQIKCAACHKNLATLVCTYCDDDHGWLCAECATAHEHDEEAFLPVVNSPRVGVCGYDGGMSFGDFEIIFDDEDEEE